MACPGVVFKKLVQPGYITLRRDRLRCRNKLQTKPGGEGGVVALIAILLPSMFLVIGTLPYWNRLRSLPGAQAALLGANAVVVGILLAALYDPVFLSGITSGVAMIIGLLAFGSLQFWKMPPWLVVIICAGLGGILL